MPEFVGQGDRYRLIRFIGEDWLGQIWHGEDTSLRTAVTIRLVRGSLTRDRGQVEVFREQQTALYPRLAHPNVAGVYDFRHGEGPVAFVVMEEMRGQTLAHRLKRGPRVQPQEGFAIGMAIAECLQAAHDLGFAHDALTSHSVMLNDDGSVKIMDFGLAALRPASEYRPETEGSAEDVRALAALLREMSGSWAVIGDPGDPSQGMGARLLRLWQSSLDPDPTKRPSAGALASALREAADPEVVRHVRTGMTAERAVSVEPDRPEEAPGDAGGSVHEQATAEPAPPADPVEAPPAVAASTGEPVEERRRQELPDVEEAWAHRDRDEEPGEGEERRAPNAGLRLLRGQSWLWLAGTVLIAGALLALFLVWPAMEPSTRQPVPIFPESTTGSEAMVMTDLRGLTFSEARSRLEQTDLLLARRVEAQGEPGVVVATDPGLGQQVRPGTPVTIYVGAE